MKRTQFAVGGDFLRNKQHQKTQQNDVHNEINSILNFWNANDYPL
jgi:hypothetical protein